MKLLLDQGLPRSTVAHLAIMGISAEHVSSLGLSRAADDQILEEARKGGSVVATLDADFHRILATQGAATPSVIRIRIEGLKGDELAALLAKVVADVGVELANGVMVSVSETHARVRSLPII